MIVSIDIGTTYSSMCMLSPDGKPVPVAIGEAGTGWGDKYSLPTAVFVEENGKVLVGQAAMRSRMKNPSCFCMEFKRNLGENEPKLIGNRSFKIEELYTEVFLHMKNCLRHLSQEQIEKVYLTYPAAYGKDKKERLLASAKAAGFLHVELVDEPGAAAMSYCTSGYVKEGQIVLVYDFGGGTFDAALVKYENGTFRILGEPAGLPRCGGMDMDRLIAKDMLGTVGEEMVADIRKNMTNYMRFTSQISEKSIRIKHQLSSAETAEEYIPMGWESLNYVLSREKFEQMTAPKVGDTIQLCTRLLESTDIKKEELSAVLLVGGTSRVPLVRQMVENFAKGVPVYSAPDLELAVVQGALSYSRMKEGDKAEEYFQKGEELDAEAKKDEPRKEMGFVAVSIGAGMNDTFRGLGVDYIIEGGQTMDPSTEDMLTAIDNVNADHVFILPNSWNIIKVANQAAQIVEDKEIIVIPTKTVPQGITAVINYLPDVSAEENKETMIEAISTVKTGQVTYAVRATEIDGFEIRVNDFMGIGDKAILAVGKDMNTVTVQMLEKMIDEDSEMVNIYFGSHSSEDDAAVIAEAIKEKYPDVDVEINNGGQPIYYYVISVE